MNNIIIILILSFFLGILSSFSLPPYNFIILNFFTFPTLLYLIINYYKKKFFYFSVGWIFGFGYFLSNIYWITNSLTFDENLKPLIPVTIIVIPLFLGLFYGLAAYIITFIKLEKNFSSILIFSVSFSCIEFLRGFIFGGFPWNLIVYSWTDYLNSIQILSIIGTYSFNLISTTIFLLPLLIYYKKNLRFKVLLLTILAVLLISNHFYGYYKIKKDEQFISKLENFKIKIVSPTISINRFFEPNNEEVLIKELIQLSAPNPSEKTIFVFPEGALAGVNFDKLTDFSKIFSESYTSQHIIIMGINIEEKVNNSKKIFNSMIVVDSNLNLISEYRKINLVPFGEFLPFEKFLKKIGLKKIGYGYESFSSGSERNILRINENFSFIPLICYEIIYSGKINLKDENSNFIINISEDGWFGNTIGPHQHFSHTIFRAIEEGKNLVRSVNNGISAYIDSNGIIVSKLKSSKKGVIEVENYKKFNETLFSKFGNKIFFYILIFYIILILYLKRREL